MNRVSMLKKIFNKSDKNQMKKNVLYIFLLISNIVLFSGLITYYSNIGTTISIPAIDEISAVIATVIILGFISTKLPNIKNMGDNPLFVWVHLF